MYILKKEIAEEIKKKRINRKIAEKVGVTEQYVSNIVNYNQRSYSLSKTVAYAITKALDNEYEIQDVFDVVEE